MPHNPVTKNEAKLTKALSPSNIVEIEFYFFDPSQYADNHNYPSKYITRYFLLLRPL